MRPHRKRTPFHKIHGSDPPESHARASRRAYAWVLAVVTPLGLATKLYSGPGAAWVADNAGGFFYVLFWVFLLLTLVPGASPGKVAIWVLGSTCILEALQLWHPPLLEAIRSTLVGRALIGTTFSWWDFAYYLLAAAVVPLVARCARSVDARRLHIRS